MLRSPDQGGQQKKGLEEQYERMFPKIGRDFVAKEDMQDILDLLQRVLDLLSGFTGGAPVGRLTLSGAKAMTKALLYKDVVETGKDGTKLFKDLVEIDDDDDEASEEETPEEE